MIKQLGFACIALLVMNGSISAQTGNNQLTAAEKSAGWKLLFDGTRTKGWHDYNKKTIDNAWQAIDAREPTLKWNVTSTIISEDLQWVEVQAVQLKGGDE